MKQLGLIASKHDSCLLLRKDLIVICYVDGLGIQAPNKKVVDELIQSKLTTKNIDLIIANDVSNNKVFGKDSNKVYVIDKKSCEEWPEQNKKSVAFKIADRICDILSYK